EKVRLGELLFEIQRGDARQMHVLLVRRAPLAGRRSGSAGEDCRTAAPSQPVPSKQRMAEPISTRSQTSVSSTAAGRA
ncbi:hypothetical protein AAHH79_41680, partial [Burkholderia pseudomallei]